MNSEGIDFWSEQRKKQFLIVGIGSTGYHVAALFLRQRISFFVSDIHYDKQVKRKLLDLGLKANCFFEGLQDARQLRGVDAIILSPGILRQSPWLLQAKKEGIAIWNDYDFLYPLYKEKIIIGVTGTDGKTTVVSLLEKVLATHFGRNKVVACGNNGRPFASIFSRLDVIKCIVLELSSYMLEEVKQFKANIAYITNIAADHLDRYPNFSAYQAVKLHLIECCKRNGYFIHNLDAPSLDEKNFPKYAFQSGRKGKKIKRQTISLQHKQADFYASLYKSSTHKDDTILQVEDKPMPPLRLPFFRLKLIGAHNRLNALLALAVLSLCLRFKSSKRNKWFVHFNKAIRSLESTKPLPHRMEKVPCRIKKIIAINDSKATTVQAVICALESFSFPKSNNEQKQNKRTAPFCLFNSRR